MKKTIIVFLAFFCFYVNLPAQPADSLLQQRTTLNEKYQQLSIPGKELTIKDYKAIVDILKKIVIVDTRIIESYSAIKTKIKNLQIEKESLNTENNDLSKKISEYSRITMIIYISGGVLISLTVLLFILYVFSNRKYLKLRKETTSKN